MSDNNNENIHSSLPQNRNRLNEAYLMRDAGYCHCCEGIRKHTPAQIVNGPSLSELKYRIGTHGMFKASMLSELSVTGELSKLTTREDNDLAIAIIDGWACIADVLTFYQERIINEVFLRTATERMSILELARSIGYELNPGVASDTLLAFRIEESNPQIGKSIIEKGTKIQSIPQQGEMPQTYETIETIEARPELNEINASTKIPQIIDQKTNKLYFDGLETALNKEDGIFILSKSSGQEVQFFAKVMNVNEDDKNNVTTVDIRMIWSSESIGAKDKTLNGNEAVGNIGKKSDLERSTISSSIKKNFASNQTRSKLGGALLSIKNELSLSEVSSLSVALDIDEKEVIEEQDKTQKEVETLNGVAIQVYAFRKKASIFGHDAPSYQVLTFPLRDDAKTFSNWDNEGLPIYKKVNIISNGAADAQGNFVDYNLASPQEPIIFFDNLYENIFSKDNDENNSSRNWVVFYSENRELENRVRVFPTQITNTSEETLIEYAVTGKVTGIKLREVTDLPNSELSNFRRRNTTVFVQSEELKLTDRIDETPVKGKFIDLEKGVTGLHKGQRLIITGEALDQNGQSTGRNNTEYRNIIEATTKKIIFDRELDGSYVRKSVRIFANIAMASHGETNKEIVGSGDPALLQQSFRLKQKPLTYIKAPTPTGGLSTLEIRVDDILWKEVDYLYGVKSNEHVFISRKEDDGTTVITFGDGDRGSRPNQGIENIIAKYRVGTGKEGIVKQGQLSILIDRPLGVISVTNPFPTTAAADPENLQSARSNAPLKVLTLDRLVSISDFEYFAKSFGGIGKALSSEIWDGTKNIVLLSLGSSTGKRLDYSTTENIIKSIEKHKDPQISFRVESFVKKTFSISAQIRIDPNFLYEKIHSSVKNRILDTFSFEKRQFGQSVTLSEVVTLIQNTEGVLSVDVDTFQIDKIDEEIMSEMPTVGGKNQQQLIQQYGLQRYLLSKLPFYDETLKKIIPAELLIVNPQGINLFLINE